MIFNLNFQIKMYSQESYLQDNFRLWFSQIFKKSYEFENALIVMKNILYNNQSYIFCGESKSVITLLQIASNNKLPNIIHYDNSENIDIESGLKILHFRERNIHNDYEFNELSKGLELMLQKI